MKSWCGAPYLFSFLVVCIPLSVPFPSRSSRRFGGPHIDPRLYRIVCSIFVNPTQFGAGEDFEKYVLDLPFLMRVTMDMSITTHAYPPLNTSRYPRPFENDVKKLTENQIDAVFAPEWTEVYPPPAIGEVVSVRGGSEPLDAGTWVTAPSVDATTEGLTRPGHFRGVATVVTKLFNIVQPDEAFFGTHNLSYPLLPCFVFVLLFPYRPCGHSMQVKKMAYRVSS